MAPRNPIDWPQAYAASWRELRAIDRAYSSGELQQYISTQKQKLEEDFDDSEEGPEGGPREPA